MCTSEDRGLASAQESEGASVADISKGEAGPEAL
jgi:hypothetical protein